MGTLATAPCVASMTHIPVSLISIIAVISLFVIAEIVIAIWLKGKKHQDITDTPKRRKHDEC